MVKARVESAGFGVKWDLVNCRRRATFLLNMNTTRAGGRGTRGYERLFMYCVFSRNMVSCSCRQLCLGSSFSWSKAVRKDSATRGVSASSELRSCSHSSLVD